MSSIVETNSGPQKGRQLFAIIADLLTTEAAGREDSALLEQAYTEYDKESNLFSGETPQPIMSSMD